MIATGHSERTKQIIDHITQKARDGKDGAIVVRTDETAIQELRRRIEALETLPPKPANDPAAIPLAIGKLLERIEALEQRPIDTTPTAVSQDDIADLQSAIKDVGVSALKAVHVLMKRIDALEARISNIKLEIVEDTLGELRSSA